jgi:hypothetical protein
VTWLDGYLGHIVGYRQKGIFTIQYRIRSNLAHGNLRDKPDLTKDALNQQYLELLRFVLDILESWTENPSFDTTPGTTNLISHRLFIG